MPTETAIFLAFTLFAFGVFALTLGYVDMATKKVRHDNHPIPGE